MTSQRGGGSRRGESAQRGRGRGGVESCGGARRSKGVVAEVAEVRGGERTVTAGADLV